MICRHDSRCIVIQWNVLIYRNGVSHRSWRNNLLVLMQTLCHPQWSMDVLFTSTILFVSHQIDKSLFEMYGGFEEQTRYI